ncbi:MAG: hypothetical protein QXY99_05240 [Thermoproteota archaeon]
MPRRRGISRILAEILLVVIVLSALAGAYTVYSMYYSNSYTSNFEVTGFAVGNRLFLNLKNDGAFKITWVNVSYTNPYVGKFDPVEVEILPGETKALVFECQSPPQVNPVKAVVQAKAENSRDIVSKMIALTVIFSTVGGGGGGAGEDQRPFVFGGNTFSISGTMEGNWIPSYHIFVAAGRIWIFYVDPMFGEPHQLYCVSAPVSNPMSFNEPTSICDVVEMELTMSFDGSAFHAIIEGQWYYKIIPNSDGTVETVYYGDPRVLSAPNEWTTLDRTYAHGFGDSVVYFLGSYLYVIVVDDVPYVQERVVLAKYAVSDNGMQYLGQYSVHSFTASTSNMFAFTNVYSHIVKLSDGTFYLLYYATYDDDIPGTGKLYGRTFNPQTEQFGQVETIYDGELSYYLPHAEGTSIHLALIDRTGKDVRYMQRTTAWSSPVTVYSGPYDAEHLSMSVVGGSVHIFWAVEDGGGECTTIKYSMKSSGGSFREPTDLVTEVSISCDEGSDGIISNRLLAPFAVGSNPVVLAWLEADYLRATVLQR